MITKDNLRAVLGKIGFVRDEANFQDVMKLDFADSPYGICVNFTTERIEYPEGIKVDRETTVNFSKNENFVVLQCVCTLLKQGYLPEHIVLEPRTPGGREDTFFYGDILVHDNDDRAYMLVECKTEDGKEDDEFNKAWKKTLQDGGQLFNYFNTYRQAQYLVLYAADFVNGDVRPDYRLITMVDNVEYLESNPTLISFEKVSHDNGTRDDYFRVWSETYGKDNATNGAFEIDVPAFGVTKKKLTIEDLFVVDGQDIQHKYHQFAQTLRKYNVASHENAFDKLVNLFLVKVVDEVRNPKDLQFMWKGAAYDDYYSFQDRLQRLYQIGMKDYLDEDVTYIDNASIENAFRMQRNDPDAIKDTILEYFRQLKFYSNSDFGFLDVHNKQLFVQNSVILKAMVEMLQDMRLKTDQQNQFLGDLFEGFLDQGVKQNEGQFFTPIPITRFMVSSLPLEQIIKDNTEIPQAIDYACGAGHFLNEYASRIKPIVEQYKGTQSLPDYYKHIYGIEKEYRLSKVSKVSSFMYGQDGIQIIYGDALVPHEQIKDGEFDVLIANPPYSVTGFLATLSKEERNAYELNAEVDSKQLETNNSIETFFVERAKQLLAPEGVAAIILPSNIPTKKSSIVEKTREILLKYFDFLAIVEFGGGTFGKTKSTSTVVLFLRRKKSDPELAEHCKNRVSAWFANNHGQDVRYDDAGIIERYAKQISVPLDDYKSLLNNTPTDDLWNNELFSLYKDKFENDSTARRIRQKRITTRYTQEQKDADLNNYVLNSIRAIEQEKLFYFMLCESNPQPVIIVKSPTRTNDVKLFLGYDWSDRKGSEGIKYLGAVDEDDENALTANKGIQQIQTPLFDPNNLTSDEKINTLIRKNYLGEDIEVPDSLSDYVTMLNLSDMLDFNSVDFDKVIKTSVEFKMVFETKYEKVRMSSVVSINPSKSELSIEDNSTSVSFVEMSTVSEKGFISQSVNKAYSEVRSGGYTYFAEGDIIIAKITPCMENGKCAIATGLTNGIGFGSSEFHVLRCGDSVLNTYLFALLNTDIVRQVAEKNMTGRSGHRRVPASFYSNMEIPLPPKDIQEKIADEMVKIDDKFKHNPLFKQEEESERQQVLDKYLK